MTKSQRSGFSTRRLRRLRKVYATGLEVLSLLKLLSNNVSKLRHFEELKAVGFDSATLRVQNPLCARPRSYWSQADEDGILEEILRRVSPPKTFLEIGVGDGLENNTAFLLSIGWSGAWVGDEQLEIDVRDGDPLKFVRQRVDMSNLLRVVDSAVGPLNEDIGVISVDVDGNDYHFVEALLLAGVRPTIWIVEYNGRFPVGSDWVMPYSADHTWDGSDFFGASLTAFSNLMRRFGFRLVACSSQGSNAFFVKEGHLDQFADCLRDDEDLYMPPLYLYPKFIGHRPDPRSLEVVLARSRAGTLVESS